MKMKKLLSILLALGMVAAVAVSPASADRGWPGPRGGGGRAQVPGRRGAWLAGRGGVGDPARSPPGRRLRRLWLRRRTAPRRRLGRGDGRPVLLCPTGPGLRGSSPARVLYSAGLLVPGAVHQLRRGGHLPQPVGGARGRGPVKDV